MCGKKFVICDKCPGELFDEGHGHCDKCEHITDLPHCDFNTCNKHHLGTHCDKCVQISSLPHCDHCSLHHHPTIKYCDTCKRCGMNGGFDCCVICKEHSLPKSYMHCKVCNKHHEKIFEKQCSDCKACWWEDRCTKCQTKDKKKRKAVLLKKMKDKDEK